MVPLYPFSTRVLGRRSYGGFSHAPPQYIYSQLHSLCQRDSSLGLCAFHVIDVTDVDVIDDRSLPSAQRPEPCFTSRLICSVAQLPSETIELALETSNTARNNYGIMQLSLRSTPPVPVDSTNAYGYVTFQTETVTEKWIMRDAVVLSQGGPSLTWSGLLVRVIYGLLSLRSRGRQATKGPPSPFTAVHMLGSLSIIIKSFE